MQTNRAKVAAAVAVAVLGVAGCGGSKSDDKAQASKDIASTLKTAFTTTDVDVKCGELVTASFVKRVYGDAATCRKAETPSPDDKNPTGVNTSNTTVNGDKATTKVSLQGGDAPGATGTVDFAKEDGKWKVDDLEVDLLRSQFTKGLQGASIPQLTTADSKSCLLKEVNGLGDADLQRLAYGAIADSSAATQQLSSLIVKCQPDDSSSDSSSSSDSGKSVSFLRKKFEEGLAKSAKADGATSAQITCIKKQLRKTISDDQIIAEIGRKKVSAALTQKAAVAIQSCRSASS